MNASKELDDAVMILETLRNMSSIASDFLDDVDSVNLSEHSIYGLREIAMKWHDDLNKSCQLLHKMQVENSEYRVAPGEKVEPLMAYSD